MPQKQSRSIEFDDFIGSKIKIEGGFDTKARLLDFSHIKISKIDPNIRAEIEQRLKNIRQNLQKLKSISSI